MPNRPLSTLVFRRQSPPPPQAAPTDKDIVFPKVYEDAWGSGDGLAGSDSGKARIFLLRMATMNPDPTMSRLGGIVKDPKNRSVQALAAAVQMEIFGDRHATFMTSPLMQCIRFMLIKTRLPDSVLDDRGSPVIDFFFDPTLERNLRPPPSGEVVVYPSLMGRLKVVIVGGGPTALASAMSLAEKGAGKVEVHMYERRWVRKENPDGTSYIDYPPTAKRRDQVVTLQDSVTTLLSKPGYQALFAGRPERVWPGSANIQIRKVEDRFLKRVQDPEFQGRIHLHPEGVSREDLSKVGDFHVLLGTDGAASWVRKSYFHGYENERGRSYALGLAFDRPAGLPWSQPLNVFLTLGQTRYLLNASDHDGRGYLNMQLTENEWHKMVAIDGQPVHFGRPGCLRRPDGSVPEGFDESQVFAPSEDRGGPMWTAISDGLKLFGFKESEVINIVRIPIVVQAVKEGVQVLPREDATCIKRHHALVAVAGDAAMTVHFWPGRGLNSGIKSGLALGDEFVHALNNNRFINLPLDALKEYNDFILKLQMREHDKRSIPILNQSGTPETLGWLLDKANSVPDNVAIDWLVGAMMQIADRLEPRHDWAFEPVRNVEPQLRIILRQLDPMTLKEMAVSFPWPTREMAGAEVLPIRSMKPEEKKKWLQDLWGMLKDDKKKGRPASRSDADRRTPSSARFEAPRSSSPLPSPSLKPSSALKRTNATQSIRHGTRPNRLSVSGSRPASPDPQLARLGRTTSAPNTEGYFDRSSSPSPELDPNRQSRTLSIPKIQETRPRSPSFGPGGEVSIGRMLTIHRKPPPNVLSDALSLALFRVQET